MRTIFLGSLILCTTVSVSKNWMESRLLGGTPGQLTNTFIINEEGTVFSLDKGAAAYDAEYPDDNPTEQNYEIAN